VLNRRDFCMSILAVPAFTSNIGLAGPTGSDAPKMGGGFPLSDYTPYGYLDNPFHSWNLHRSGVLRSSPGIGFGFYFPAGPGGYFDFAKNGVYEAHLRLGFLINGRQFWAPEHFHPGQLTSPYHSKNLLTFAFAEEGTTVESTFLQVGENALAARISLQTAQARSIRLMAVLDCKLGGAAWWGRDGLVGSYDPAVDAVSIRCFAAGKVFILMSDFSSQAHFVGEQDADLRSWLDSPSRIAQGISYYPKPLYAALLFNIDASAGAQVEHTFVLVRAANAALANEEARQSLGKVQQESALKYGEDAKFWSTAPQLAGEWPIHWKHGWIYDWETLRMMVRRPIGVYKHPWDAMQIQAPRTVLAESSIDMWALSYADAGIAKEVFFGLFANAPSDGVPCSREDGEMNMVACDGAECGTSISWCHPFFCAASIWARTRDREWLSKLYPLLGRFLRWTLKNRTDTDGFVIGKCSWETGMDTSTRFLIQQPTGGELIEFLRIVELQAATSYAAGILQEFAEVLGDTNSGEDWQKIQQFYAAKTQTLWKEDWFYDFDTRNGQLVTSIGRDVGQVAPLFCGIASDDQKQKMRPALRKFFEDSVAGRRSVPGAEDWQDGLHWSSLVLPYVESLWRAGEIELVSQLIHAIAERVYTSMDRPSIASPSSKGGQLATAPKLGWPGISCEVWGEQGAYGGEGYGWGAVLPAHIIRSVIGLRDPQQPDELPLSPNLPNAFMVAGKTYRVLNLQCAGASLELAIRALDSKRVRVEGSWSGGRRSVAVRDARGADVSLQGTGSVWQFDGVNHEQYFVRLTGISQA
jgi:Trehalase